MTATMISADDHIDLGFLPADLWTERLPEALKDRGPYVKDLGEDEGEQWICDGQQWGEWRGGRWPLKPDRPVHALDRGGVNKPHTHRPTTPDLRLEDMARDGVDASVMFPPILGLTAADRDLKIGIIEAYNDWAAEFSRAAPSKFFPNAQLFPDDMEASRDEVLRTAELGLKQGCFLVGTVTPEMYTPEWEPFWAAVDDTGMIVSYHAGGWSDPSRWPKVLGKPIFQMGIAGAGVPFINPLVSLFTQRILENHPKLKIVLGESAIGWIPFIVQLMDHYYLRAVENGGGKPLLSGLPSELFKRHVWATYQEDLVGLHLLDFFGDDKVMWASDYPHPDSTWPYSQEIVEKETAHLNPEVKRRVLHDNAAALYGL